MPQGNGAVIRDQRQLHVQDRQSADNVEILFVTTEKLKLAVDLLLIVPQQIFVACQTGLIIAYVLREVILLVYILMTPRLTRLTLAHVKQHARLFQTQNIIVFPIMQISHSKDFIIAYA